MRRLVGLWLAGAVAGAVQFWVVQVATGGPTITAFIGEEIVTAGGYPAGLAPVVGWAVHGGVSLAYAALVGVLGFVFRPVPLGLASLVSLVVALALGWVTTLIAPPAISVTIALLGGQGWPPELFPLNTEPGLPLWNHLAFFGLNWLIQVVGPRALTSCRPDGASERLGRPAFSRSGLGLRPRAGAARPPRARPPR